MSNLDKVHQAAVAVSIAVGRLAAERRLKNHRTVRRSLHGNTPNAFQQFTRKPAWQITELCGA